MNTSRLALLALLALPACRTAHAPPDHAASLPATVAVVSCYSVCHTTEAVITADGQVRRTLSGQVLGPGRVPADVRGADTLSVDRAALDSLALSLRRYEESGLPPHWESGREPCDVRAGGGHGGFITITWQGATGVQTLRIDEGCYGETGRVRAIEKLARTAARFDTMPFPVR
jgi:hypothetical protein